jgi:hypothetical protein
MIKKQCTKCKEIKSIDEFHKCKAHKDGHKTACKKCTCEASIKYYNCHKEHYKELWEEYKINNVEKLEGRGKIYYQNNKEKCSLATKKWREENPDKVKEMKLIYRSKLENLMAERKSHKIWLEKHPENIKEYSKNRYQKDKDNIMIKLNTNIRKGIWESLKGAKNSRHWEDLLGYTLEDLLVHLKNLFTDGMSWKLYLQGKIHIDHIIPISLWKFESYNDREFKQCWSLCNLQPLWATDNLKKGNKI